MPLPAPPIFRSGSGSGWDDPNPERFRLKKGTPFGVLVVMKPKQAQAPRREADQTVRLPIDTKDHTSSIRIGFTDQRSTAHGGIEQRPQAGGKSLLEVPGYRFQALVTHLPANVDALTVWRRYNGRADIENRIKELGQQFGLKRLCADNFWGTEAMHHWAIGAEWPAAFPFFHPGRRTCRAVPSSSRGAPPGCPSASPKPRQGRGGF
jgi:hypothetical protein